MTLQRRVEALERVSRQRGPTAGVSGRWSSLPTREELMFDVAERVEAIAGRKMTAAQVQQMTDEQLNALPGCARFHSMLREAFEVRDSLSPKALARYRRTPRP